MSFSSSTPLTAVEMEEQELADLLFLATGLHKVLARRAAIRTSKNFIS